MNFLAPKLIQHVLAHTTYSRNNMGQKCEGNCGLWVLNEIIKKYILKIWKKSWEPFGSYLLNSTANTAQFEWKWAGLAVLFSRQLQNGSLDYFHIFSICNSFYNSIKNPQTTIALTFLTHNISDTGGVLSDMQGMEKVCYGGDSTFHDSYAKDPTKSLLNDDTACHECNWGHVLERRPDTPVQCCAT